MGCRVASVHGTTFGPADQRHPIDQGHVPEPWKWKRQTLPPPKPTVRTSALALNAWSSVRRWHTTRGIESQRGSGRYHEGRHYVRWCFGGSEDAKAFQDEFGGQLIR